MIWPWTWIDRTLSARWVRLSVPPDIQRVVSAAIRWAEAGESGDPDQVCPAAMALRLAVDDLHADLKEALK